MDIKAYIQPLLKWWWLLLLAGMVAAVSSFVITWQQPPIYEARTTLVMGRAVFENNPDAGTVYMNQILAAYYSDLARRDRVRSGTMETLGLSWLPEYKVYPLANSQLIEIVVTDSNPARAQAVANELAQQLIQQSPASSASDTRNQAEFIQQQLDYHKTKIEETLAEIEKKEKELGDLVGAREIADAQAEIGALQTKLTTLQTNYATLLNNTESGASNTLTVLEEARLPGYPVGPQKSRIILLSTLVAVAIAGGAAYLLEYMDDTLHNREEVTKLLNLPVLGELPDMGKGNILAATLAQKPRSPLGEAMRGLRTNLDFLGVDKPVHSILITSASASEGKTFVATHLAVVLAQAGKKTTVLDADLRSPRVHTYLDLDNQQGLSEVFRGQVDLHDVLRGWEEEKVFVVTSGAIPPNPTDLIASAKMDQILQSLKNASDVLVIDGPPLTVPDATILASKVDVVLVVVRHSFTRRNHVAERVEDLRNVGVRPAGVVLNRSPHTSGYYYRYYNYKEPRQSKAEYRKNGSGSLENKNGKVAVKKGRRAEAVDRDEEQG